MKFKVSSPMLPALALPLLTASALGQTVGTAHPEPLNDPITGTPPRNRPPRRPQTVTPPATLPPAPRLKPATRPRLP